MSVALAGGARYALPGFRISVTCGTVRIAGWAPLANLSEIPNPTRAPAS